MVGQAGLMPAARKARRAFFSRMNGAGAVFFFFFLQ